MRILIIGNKPTDNLPDVSKYDFIVRYNCCDNLDKTYTDKTDIWYFGGSDFVFKKNTKQSVIDYLNSNAISKYIVKPHHCYNLIKSYTELNDYVTPSKYCCELAGISSEGVNRFTTAVQIVCYCLYHYRKDEIYISCMDKDRNFRGCNNPWHSKAALEQELLYKLEEHGLVHFI